MSIKERLEINDKEMHEKALELINLRNQYDEAISKGEDENYIEFLASMIDGTENQMSDLEYEYNQIVNESYSNDYDYEFDYDNYAF